jgi:hypothetical protein
MMSGRIDQQRAIPGQHNISKRRAEFFGHLRFASKSQLPDLDRSDFSDAPVVSRFYRDNGR